MVYSSFMIYTLPMKLLKIISPEKESYTIVDDEDYELVCGYRWRLHRGYVQACTKGTTIHVHRLILGLKPKVGIVDHIDGNPLNNQKSNLRLCTSSQNSMNRRKSIVNKSGYKGVCWRYNTNGKNWCATIYKNAKQFHLGYFWTAEEAAKVYDEKALELFGDFARLNYPLEDC